MTRRHAIHTMKQQLAAESKTGCVMCVRRRPRDSKVVACKSIRTTHKRGSRLYLGAGGGSVCASVGSLKSGSKPSRHLSHRLSSKHTKPGGGKQSLPARWQPELLDMTGAAKFCGWSADTKPSDLFKQRTLTPVWCTVLKSSSGLVLSC